MKGEDLAHFQSAHLIPLYSSLEAATGRSGRTLRRWRRDGLLPPSVVIAQVRFVTKRDLTEWLARQEGRHGHQ